MNPQLRRRRRRRDQDRWRWLQLPWLLCLVVLRSLRRKYDDERVSSRAMAAVALLMILE